MMYRLIASLALACLSLPAMAQTLPACTPGSAAGTPVPTDQTKLTWDRAVFSDGTTLGNAESYVVHSRLGTTGTMTPRCITTRLDAQMLAQPAGTNAYAVSTRLAGFPDSVLSMWAQKVNAVPKVLNPPTNVTVDVTLIGGIGWTCNDEQGAVLSNHVRPDQAQESCTNFALANVGKPFEMKAAGVYRVVAR